MTTGEIIKALGVKPTAARVAVLAVLQAQMRVHPHQPLTARDIWERVHKDKTGKRHKQPIGVASVYRALAVLHAAGAVRKLPAEQGAAYEYCEDEVAPQLVCSRCGKTEDIRDPALLAYNTSVVKSRGLPESDALLLYADCRKKECDSD